MTTNEERINALHEELVPFTGKAPTVAGEIIRAVSRIGYRFYNDGDHLGVGYGKETCNPAGRYLMRIGGDKIANAIDMMWGVWDAEAYMDDLEDLMEAVLEHLDQHPELKQTKNVVDMFSFATSEDVDNCDGEEYMPDIYSGDEPYEEPEEDYGYE